jgi:hypothetical protein
LIPSLPNGYIVTVDALLRNGGYATTDTSEPPAEVLWGFPCGAQIDADWFSFISGWMDSGRHVVSMPKPARHAGRIDLARSYLIDCAKQNKPWRSLWTWDADCVPMATEMPQYPQYKRQTQETFVELIQEDFDNGFDVVHGPTVNVHGRPSFGFDTAEGYLVVQDDAPFHCDWFTGSFIAFSRKAIDAIQPAATLVNQDGQKFVLYCRMGQSHTEDADLCANMRKVGISIGVDPRLLVGHRKPIDRFIDKDWWKLIRLQAQAELKARAEAEKEKLGSGGTPAPA